MRQVLEQLAGTSGVVGALVCDAGGALREASFPPVFDAQALEHAAALLVSQGGAAEALVRPGDAVELRYTRGRAIVRRWSDGLLLVVGTAGADRQLLAFSVEQAVRRLEALVAAPVSVAEVPVPVPRAPDAPRSAEAPPTIAVPPMPAAAPMSAPPPPAPVAAPVTEPIPAAVVPAAVPPTPAPAPVPVPPEVERIRSRLRDALIRQIGPFGGMAFQERWTAWYAEAPPSKARLRALVDDLAREIDDPEARLAYFVEAGAAIG